LNVVFDTGDDDILLPAYPSTCLSARGDDVIPTLLGCCMLRDLDGAITVVGVAVVVVVMLILILI